MECGPIFRSVIARFARVSISTLQDSIDAQISIGPRELRGDDVNNIRQHPPYRLVSIRGMPSCLS